MGTRRDPWDVDATTVVDGSQRPEGNDPRVTAKLTEGEIIGGRFEILGRLGKGAFGTVFRARDLTAAEVVALKLVRQRSHATGKQAVRSELHAARKVTHPGVVRIHDIVELDDELALSMEFIDGETLQARLERTPQIDETELRALAIQLLQALAAAHEAGVVHCDLKPANIILRAGNGRAVITDFGISQWGVPPDADDSQNSASGASTGTTGPLVPLTDLATVTMVNDITVTSSTPPDALNKAKPIRGTPVYMAPELFLGGSEFTSRVDIYALGVVLYQCATGAWPHKEAAGALAFIKARLGGPPPPLATLRPDLSPELCQVVDNCLAVDPAKRSDCYALLAILQPPAVTEPNAVLLLPRRGRRLLYLTLALILGLVIGAVAGYWQYLGSLPSESRQLWIKVVNRGAQGDDWIARAAQQMVDRWGQDPTRRLPIVATEDQANVIVQLALARAGQDATFDIEVKRRDGRARSLGRVHASSVATAVRRAFGVLQTKVFPREPSRSASESDGLWSGAASAEAARLYRSATDDYFSSVLTELRPVEDQLNAAIRADPGWAHPRALLVLVQGRVTPQAQATLKQASAELGTTERDPAGRAMLAALDRLNQHQLVEAEQILQQARAQQQDDIVVLDMLSLVYYLQHRSSDLVAITQTLHLQRPDLQFGSDLAAALQRAGRNDEIPPLIERWFTGHPASEQALTAQIGLDINAGRYELAQRRARDLLFLHGTASHCLLTSCDAVLVAGKTQEARSTATQLVASPDSRSRALGQHRLGIIAILEGKFASAREQLASALDGQRPFGGESEILQTLQALSSLDAMLDDRSSAEMHLAELERMLDSFGADASARIVHAERLLLVSPKRCPDLTSQLGRIGDLRERILVRRNILRAAAMVGCVACKEALEAGLGTEERSTRSLFRFGLCAEREGDLQRAIDAFTRAAMLIASSLHSGNDFSPDLAIRAHLHLGRLYERRHDLVAARREYRRFLDAWEHADRRLPELDEAREALKRLP